MKEKKTLPKITIRIYPDLDDEVDDALELAESDMTEAQRIMNRLLFKYPRYHSVLYGMGTLRIMQNEEDKALEYYKKAVRVNPFFVEAWFNMGSIYQNKLKIGNLIDAFMKVIEFGDKSSEIVKVAKDLINEIEKIAKEDGLTALEYRNLEFIFLEAFEDMEYGYYDDAIAGFKKVIEKNPNHVQSYGNLGLCYGLKNNFDQAIEHFDKAIKLDPNYEPAINNKKMLIELNKAGKSLKEIPFVSTNYYTEDFIKEK